VQTIGAGCQHSSATVAGTVWSWGDNCWGQLGNGTQTDSHVAVQVLGDRGTGVLPGITSASGGLGHSVAVGGKGDIHTWGLNSGGQLGVGSVTGHLVPNPGSALSGITAIAAGARPVC